MKYPWMPLFWGDFFSKTLHLSAQEVGAYILLIGAAWQDGGRLPFDRLQRIARVSPYHWPRVWKRLEPFFEVELSTTMGSPSWVAHRRVLDELAKADELSNKRKVAAMHMHNRRRANAQQHQNLDAGTNAPSTITNKKSLNAVKASKPPIAKPNRPTVHSDFQEDGTEYRSPPRTKSDLPPMTEEQRQAAMILAAKGGRG